MNWNFSEVLEESNGGYSSIRLAFLTWALVILIVWATISIQNRTFPMVYMTYHPYRHLRLQMFFFFLFFIF